MDPHPPADPLDPMRDPLGLRRLGYAEPLLEHQAVRWEAGSAAGTREKVAEETPVALAYNRTPHVVMMATPRDLEDFAVGFSLTEELVTSPAEILGIEVVRYSRGIELLLTVDESRMEAIAARGRRLVGRTGCGVCGAESFDAVMKQVHPVAPGGAIRVGAIGRAMEALRTRQPLNAATGAVHAAGWARPNGDITLVREDVGRHNALDKLVGALRTSGVDPSDGFVVVTSRASFEMVQKTTVLGARLLAAISGPTGLALRVARESGLTLAGFVREDRVTVYVHPERVVA